MNLSLFGSDTAKPIVGRAPEELTIAERFQNAGRWVALELYAPPVVAGEEGKAEVDFRLRRVRAMGASAQECIAQLQQAGLNPAEFEFTRLTPAY